MNGLAVVAVVAASCSIFVLLGGDSGPRRLLGLGLAPPAPRQSTGARSPAMSPVGSQRAAASAARGSPRAGSAYAGAARWTRLVASSAAGVGLMATLGGAVGVTLGGAAAAVIFVVLGRLEPRAVRQRRERVVRDLPAATSLLAAAVSAGATPVAAIEVVAVAIGGPLGDDLVRLAALARLGGDFPDVAAPVGPADPTARLTRVVSRALDTGAPLADALDRLAKDLHAERRFEVDRRARAVGVRAAAPLGICFLPGFLLVGVIPVIAGIASSVLDFVG